MTLKTDFYDGATGLHTKMNGIFDAGATFVTDNLAALQTAMTTQAAKGVTTFTTTIVTSQEPANLRLQGIYLNHYLEGIISQLAIEDVYSHEVSLSLNISDQTTTSIDFNFTF